MKSFKPIVFTIIGTFILFSLGSSASRAGDPNDQTVRWQDIVGIIQTGNLVGTGTGKVTGAGQPWSAISGNAKVEPQDGDVHFEVRGLVLAGGNGIGTPSIITQVKGTLVCDTDGDVTGNSTLVDTPLVP